MLCFSVRLFLLEDFPVNLLVKMWGFFSPIVLLPDDHNPSRRVEHRGGAADGLTARLHAASSRALSSASEVAPSVLRGQLVLWAARTGASWWARPWLRPRRRCPDFPPATGQSLSLRLACSPEPGGRLPHVLETAKPPPTPGRASGDPAGYSQHQSRGHGVEHRISPSAVRGAGGHAGPPPPRLLPTPRPLLRRGKPREKQGRAPVFPLCGVAGGWAVRPLPAGALGFSQHLQGLPQPPEVFHCGLLGFL